MDFKTILCDFDGTLCERDIGTAIVERWSKTDWRQLEDQWQTGRISTDENIAGQWRGLEATRDEIGEFAAGHRPRQGARRFLERARDAGCRVLVVSDGLDIYIEPFLRAHAMREWVEVFSARMVGGPGRWRMETPFGRPDRCRFATCKCAIAEETLPAGEPFVLIGDGVTDACCAERAARVFARSKLLAYARAHDIECTAFETFDDIAERLFGR